MKAYLFNFLSVKSQNSILATVVGPTDESNPGAMGAKIIGDVKGWLLAIVGIYAAVQFILGAMDFMSKEPQKHSAGKDHMIHACVGLVLAFTASTIMKYLQTQTGTWTVVAQSLEQFAIMSEATRTI